MCVNSRWNGDVNTSYKSNNNGMFHFNDFNALSLIIDREFFIC
jgi:hypothetical protein